VAAALAVDRAALRSALILRTASSETGPGRYAKEVADALAPCAQLTTVLVNPAMAPSVADGEVVGGFRSGVYLIDTALNSWIPSIAFRRFRRRLARGDAIVHFAALDVPPLPTAGPAVVSILDSPSAYFGGGFYAPRLRYRVTQRHRLRTYRQFNHVLTISHHVRRALETDGFRGEISVIPPAASLSFRPRRGGDSSRSGLGLPEGKHLVLSVSSAEPRKNVATVRAVAERLGPAARLVRVGPPVPGAINLPRLDEAQLAAVYRSCDALLFPTLEEGFGFPVIEAFASGLPVVASRIDVIEEIAGDAARLEDPRDTPALTRAVREVLAAPSQWIDRGLRKAGEFSFARFRSRIRAYFGGLGLQVPSDRGGGDPA
jgi:glycosyltransferase involved in cell wall biosynthesis